MCRGWGRAHSFPEVFHPGHRMLERGMSSKLSLLRCGKLRPHKKKIFVCCSGRARNKFQVSWLSVAPWGSLRIESQAQWKQNQKAWPHTGMAEARPSSPVLFWPWQLWHVLSGTFTAAVPWSEHCWEPRRQNSVKKGSTCALSWSTWGPFPMQFPWNRIWDQGRRACLDTYGSLL
jgi:hypothetical protein